MSICGLPGEMIARVLGMLCHGDFCRVRSAHRCFCVHTIDEIWRGRRVHHWLRISPEIACKSGRSDVLAFLCARRRVPLRSPQLLQLAVEHDHVAIVRLLDDQRQRAHGSQGVSCLLSTSDEAKRIMRLAIGRGSVKMVRALCAWGPPFCMGDAIDLALELDRTDIVQALSSDAGDDDNARVAKALAKQAIVTVTSTRTTREKHSERLVVLATCASTRAMSMALLSLAMAIVDLGNDDMPPSTFPSQAARFKRHVVAIRLLAASVPTRDATDGAIALAVDLGAHGAASLLSTIVTLPQTSNNC